MSAPGNHDIASKTEDAADVDADSFGRQELGLAADEERGVGAGGTRGWLGKLRRAKWWGKADVRDYAVAFPSNEETWHRKSNQIRTTKFTPWSFLPVNLYYQVTAHGLSGFL